MKTPDRWIVPAEVELSIDNESLAWRYAVVRASRDDLAGGRRSVAEVLPQLLQLGERAANDKLSRADVLRFARVWGVFHHDGAPVPGVRGRDRIEVWGRTIALFAALDRVVRAAEGGIAAEKGDALTLIRTLGPDGVRFGMFALPIERVRADRRPATRALAREAIGYLLDAAQLHPVLRADRASAGGVRLDLEPRSLLGGLAVALVRRLQGVAGTDLRPCAGCGRLVVPKRPSQTRKAWCEKCGSDPRVTGRIRQREFQRRKAEARR